MEKYLPSTAKDLLVAFFGGGNARGMSAATIGDVIKEICAVEDNYGKEMRSE